MSRAVSRVVAGRRCFRVPDGRRHVGAAGDDHDGNQEVRGHRGGRQPARRQAAGRHEGTDRAGRLPVHRERAATVGERVEARHVGNGNHHHEDRGHARHRHRSEERDRDAGRPGRASSFAPTRDSRCSRKASGQARRQDHARMASPRRCPSSTPATSCRRPSSPRCRRRSCRRRKCRPPSRVAALEVRLRPRLRVRHRVRQRPRLPPDPPRGRESPRRPTEEAAQDRQPAAPRRSGRPRVVADGSGPHRQTATSVALTESLLRQRAAFVCRTRARSRCWFVLPRSSSTASFRATDFEQ